MCEHSNVRIGKHTRTPPEPFAFYRVVQKNFTSLLCKSHFHCSRFSEENTLAKVSHSSCAVCVRLCVRYFLRLGLSFQAYKQKKKHNTPPSRRASEHQHYRSSYAQLYQEFCIFSFLLSFLFSLVQLHSTVSIGTPSVRSAKRQREMLNKWKNYIPYEHSEKGER